MHSHILMTYLIFLALSFGATKQSSWPLLSLLFSLYFLLTSLFNVWLLPGGFAWRKTKPNGPTIPGPIGCPLLGSIPLMGPLAHRKLAAAAASLSANSLMALSFGATRVVISSDPNTAKDILCGAAFSDRPVKESARRLMFERAIGFAPSGDYWRHLRRVVSTNMFSPRGIAALEATRREAVEEMLRGVEWEKKVGVVELRGILQKGSLRSMVRSVFGGFPCLEGGELELMVKEGYELIGSFDWGDHFPILGFLDIQGIKGRCEKLGDRVKLLLAKVIEERRRKEAGGDGEDFLTTLLMLPLEEQLADSDIVAVLWEMIFRGTDTVAILMEWAMARMVLHPEIQTKAQQEIDTVVGHSRPICDGDIPSLPFLQAVVKEVLRMHPPGPLLSWARLATHDTYVGKYFVPAGTTAMVNMWAIAHNGSIWKEPWAFRPERFLEQEVSVMGSDLRLAPFGSGRRVCPGRALGLATVHLWLGRFLQEHSWVPLKSVDLAEHLRLSLEMKKPLRCRALRRNLSLIR